MKSLIERTSLLRVLAVALLQSTASGLAATPAIKLKYRPVQNADIPEIATLLTKTFEDIPGWNIIQQKMSNDKYKNMLDQRLVQLVNAGAKHSLIVAVDINNSATNKDMIAGFMELGTLPSPVPIKATWQGVETESRPEMPYLANVAVSDEYRRQGIGSTLVKLAMKIGKKWCPPVTPDDASEQGTAFLFLAVEKENVAAVQMYEGLNFDRIIDETIKLSPKALRKLERKPRLYFQKDLDLKS